MTLATIEQMVQCGDDVIPCRLDPAPLGAGAPSRNARMHARMWLIASSARSSFPLAGKPWYILPWPMPESYCIVQNRSLQRGHAERLPCVDGVVRLPVVCVFPWRVRDSGYDGSVLTADLLIAAEGKRVAVLGGLDARTQSELGQCFTHAVAVQLMASISRLPEREALRVLAPGAGSGLLAPAFVSHSRASRPMGRCCTAVTQAKRGHSSNATPSRRSTSRSISTVRCPTSSSTYQSATGLLSSMPPAPTDPPALNGKPNLLSCSHGPCRVSYTFPVFPTESSSASTSTRSPQNPRYGAPMIPLT